MQAPRFFLAFLRDPSQIASEEGPLLSACSRVKTVVGAEFDFA